MTFQESSYGLRSVKDEDLKLAMQHLRLAGSVRPFGAMLQVTHIFRSAEKKPVEAVYSFMLPRDAALRGFRVYGRNVNVSSELRLRKEADEQYEKGISEGSLSVIAQDFRDGVVNISVGNIRPGETVAVRLEVAAGVELRDDGFRLRFPFTLAPSYHPRMVAEVSEGIGEITLPEDEFGDVLLPSWAEDPSRLHTVDFNVMLEAPQGVEGVSSSSHRISVADSGLSKRVSLAGDVDVPNRDLVLDANAPLRQTVVYSGQGLKGETRFTAMIPSTLFGSSESRPRRLVFIIDHSGSMEGAPLTQAVKAVQACLTALEERDVFTVIAFDDKLTSLSNMLLPTGEDNLREAATFLSSIHAGGGTELLNALKAAVSLLGGEGGDVFLVTDGQVSGTEDILNVLTEGVYRVHCLGIGAASQDRFLSLLARRSRGVCRFLTPRERVDVAALTLFSSVKAPAASDVNVDLLSGDGVLEPAAQSTVYSGTPLIVYGRMSAPAKLRVHWGSGETTLDVGIRSIGFYEPIRVSQGARLITDLEATLSPQLDARTRSRVLKQLEKLSFEYGLASRAASLVAVVKRPGDSGVYPPKTVVVPVGMPEDVEFTSYFSRNKSKAMIMSSPQPIVYAQNTGKLGIINDMINNNVFYSGQREPESIPQKSASLVEDLISEVGYLQHDGGAPGKGLPERLAKSIMLLAAILSEEENKGIFEAHVRKLRHFIDNLDRLEVGIAEPVKSTLRMLDEGKRIDTREALLLYKKSDALKALIMLSEKLDQSK